MPDRLTEIPLHGGTANRGLVVRQGDTVRRPLRPTSSATHALLTTWPGVGFDGAPRLLGIDDQGREVLTFIPGEAVTPPYPAWALTDEVLRSVAATAAPLPRGGRRIRRHRARLAGVAPPAFDEGLACHNDLNLDNVIFRDGRAVALIDFDWRALVRWSGTWPAPFGCGRRCARTATSTTPDVGGPRSGCGRSSPRTGRPSWTPSCWCGGPPSTTTGCTS